MTVVNTSNGAVRGTFENQAHVFRGIPFAEPLAGPARWMPPQPRRPWTDVLDATAYGVASHQFGGRMPGPIPRARRRYIEAIRGTLVEGDDCLRLNVWTPTLDRGARLPVMVYIHGGGFTQGAAFDLYDASPFAARGVVTVVIQYRLGPPGFLHGSGLFERDLCADNRGFLDQLAALRWVQENAEAFAGDPGNVTVFGESAGAFSVFQLAASPLARGLFRRAIAMGGQPDTFAPAAEYHALTRDVLLDVGVKPGDSAALAALDPAAIRAMQSSIVSRVFGKKSSGRYGSIGARRTPFLGAASGTAFLPRSPIETLRAGTPNDLDLMLGTCGADGRLFSLIAPLPKAINARMFLSVIRGIVPNGDLGAIRRHYRRHPSESGAASVDERINNDAFFRMPTIAAAEAHASRSPGRTWLYQVDYESAIGGLGAIHGIEVALMFGPSQAKALIFDDAETAALSGRMLDAWTAFAKSGRPSAPGLPEWAAFDTKTRATMVFDRRTRLESDWGRAVREFWANGDAGTSPVLVNV